MSRVSIFPQGTASPTLGATSYSTAQRGPRIVTDGLILHLDVANPKSYPGSGTTWYDLTKYEQDFPLTAPNAFTSAPTFSTEGGGSFLFVSSSQTVIASTLLPEAGVSGSTYTISVWLKSNGIIPGVRQYYTNIGRDNAVNGRIELFLYYTSTIDFVAGNYGVDIYDFPSSVDTNLWYNLSFTRDSSFNAKGYVNAKLFSFNANFLGYHFGSNQIDIGAFWNGFVPNINYQGFFDGYVAQYMIYNRALTADEVQQNFSTIGPRFGYY